MIRENLGTLPPTPEFHVCIPNSSAPPSARQRFQNILDEKCLHAHAITQISSAPEPQRLGHTPASRLRPRRGHQVFGALLLTSGDVSSCACLSIDQVGRSYGRVVVYCSNFERTTADALFFESLLYLARLVVSAAVAQPWLTREVSENTFSRRKKMAEITCRASRATYSTDARVLEHSERDSTRSANLGTPLNLTVQGQSPIPLTLCFHIPYSLGFPCGPLPGRAHFITLQVDREFDRILRGGVFHPTPVRPRPRPRARLHRPSARQFSPESPQRSVFSRPSPDDLAMTGHASGDYDFDKNSNNNSRSSDSNGNGSSPKKRRGVLEAGGGSLVASPGSTRGSNSKSSSGDGGRWRGRAKELGSYAGNTIRKAGDGLTKS